MPERRAFDDPPGGREGEPSAWRPESPETWQREDEPRGEWRPDEPDGWLAAAGRETTASEVERDDAAAVGTAGPRPGLTATTPATARKAPPRPRAVPRHARSDRRARRRRRSWWRRRPRWVKVALLAGGLGIAVFGGMVADAYYQAYRVATPLQKIAGSLNKARTALSRGKLPSGDPFTQAAGLATEAERRLAGTRFTFDLVGGLPLLDRPVEVVRHQVTAAREWSRSATLVRDMLADLLGDRALRVKDLRQVETRTEGAPVLRDGAVDVDLVESLVPQLEQVIEHLESADRALRAMPWLPFPPKLADLKADALAESTSTLASARDALSGLRLIPEFLGAGEPKTYYVALQNSADQRGTGGAVLAYAILEIDGGRMILRESGPINAIDDEDNGIRGVRLPPAVSWYIQAAGVNPRLANGANYTGDFPVVAQAWAAMVERQIGRPVHGVIAIDPVAIAYALGANTELRVPTYPEEITGDNAVFVLSNDQYRLDRKPQREFPGELIAAAWPKLRSPSPLVRKLQQFGVGFRERHIQIWSSEPELQSLIERLDWDAGLEANPGDYLFLAHNKRNGNKADYYLHQDITYNVTVLPTGGIRSEYVLDLAVEMPPGEPPPIAGREVYGLDVAMENLYVPGTASIESVEPEGEVSYPTRPAGFVQHGEGPFRVFTKTVAVTPGDPERIVFRYGVPGVVQATDEGNVYQLTMQHQPMANPATITVNVSLPEGAQPRPSPGWTVDGNVATFTATLTRDLVTRIVF